MDEKLEILLKRINLRDEYYSFFENAVLDKIIISKKDNSFLVKISLDDYLPIEVIDYLNTNSNLHIIHLTRASRQPFRGLMAYDASKPGL